MRSLRARFILASILWTGGLLMLMHMLSLMVVHIVPGIRGAHSMAAVVAGLGFMIAGFVCARGGLAPFRHLRIRLAAVRSGREPRVTGDYPTEIRPLIDDLNGLIENREQSIQRAIATAGDLAHGLKTPLALLAREAGRLRSDGNIESAGAIVQQVEKISRQIDYHLARARAASSGASGRARSSLAASADGLIRTLQTLHSSRNLEVKSGIDPTIVARVQREDLDEMLGNLLDNAFKWARSRISVAARRSGETLTVTIDDDGPGVAAELRSAVFERGIRADQAAPGSGLGSAIVRDLAELYGGSVALDNSPLGGLRAQLNLPAA